MKKDTIHICTPQFDRTESLEYQFVPTSEVEFYNTINNASWEVLKGIGFGKWDTWNSVVSENRKEKTEMVVLPVFNMDEIVDVINGDKVRAENVTLLDLSPKHELPKDFKEKNLWILLFPHEWYNSIPNGFMVTGLSGEQYAFEKGKADDDKRFGCLPYGIIRNLAE